MINRTLRRARPVASILLLAGIALAAGDWTAPVPVLHEERPCLNYRAKLTGGVLTVEADLEEGWHTFSMDNKARAEEKLAGKKSLGIDRQTDIKLSNGLELDGGWMQTAPKDFSKPELRWFSWGFEKKAVFVAKVKQTGAGPATIGIRGQACTDTTCKNIDVSISLPLTGAKSGDAAANEIKDLIPVR